MKEKRPLNLPVIILFSLFIILITAVILYFVSPGFSNLVNYPSKNPAVPSNNVENYVNNNPTNPSCVPASDSTFAGLCSDNGFNCGYVSNGTCGNVTCGSCGPGYICNLTTNQCVINSSAVPSCTPASNPTLSGICGSQQCGTALNGTCSNVTCGVCSSGYTCSKGNCIQTIPPPPALP